MIYHITTQKPLFQECDVGFMLNYFQHHTDIQVDTETTGFFDFKNEILLLQLGDYSNQFVLDFQTLSQKDKDSINDRIFTNPNVTKLFQNAKFDIKFLWLHGFDIVNVYDTLLAEILLNAGRNTPDGFYSLYSIGKRYCNIELDKEVRGKIHKYGLNSRVIEYAANDVKYLEKIKEQQLKKLKYWELVKDDHQDIYTVCGLEMNAVLAFAELEYNGIKVDTTKWTEVQKEVHRVQIEVEQEINELVWEDDRLKRYQLNYHDLFTEPQKRVNVNWSSPIQKLRVVQTLYPEIEDTSERVLSRYKKGNKLISKLLEFNKINKLSTSFADKMFSHINPNTKRIHTDFWQILDTGRVSCSNPNMQQIPSRTELGGQMRSCFVAEEGYKMVGGDYSGCELRIIAEFSQDPIWVNAFLDGKDLHSELCAATFNIDIKDVKTATPFKPELKYRDVQKTIDFGLAYGMSPFKLADTMEIEVDTAAAIIDGFFGIVPDVKIFLDKLGSFGKENGYIVSEPYGRVRWFDDWPTMNFKRLGEIERQSKNMPIQAGNADMTKLALILLYRTIKENKYPVKLIHQVHDEIQAEVVEDFAEEWSHIMNSKMVEAASHILKRIPMVVDCKISDYWSK